MGELAAHQISEIVPAKGVTLVGPLPKELQKVTTYSAGVAAKTTAPELARGFEMHGGRIWVESELGKGSTFVFSIPLRLEAEDHMSAKTILYVEDNEVNRRLVRDLLKRTSYRLLEAPDGETGMAMARHEHPDLILMDVQLPKVSGIEATRMLRGEVATAETPIIAITSFALGGDEQKAREAGATAYLAKPYSPRDLLEMIRRLLPEGEGAAG